MNELIQIFELANNNLLNSDIELLVSNVSERTICGNLMLHLHEVIKSTPYKNYFVDVEYNRNKGGKIKTCIKTIQGLDQKIIKINCDLIVHSRGHNLSQDNLIAIEMKKSNCSQKKKDDDRERIIALTKDSFNDIWSVDGTTFPDHVCRYKLGVYYEINLFKRTIFLEYYSKGYLYNTKEINY